MNINNIQTENNDAQCCVDYCRTTHNVAGQEVINNYRCNQQAFSASDLWKLQKDKKEFAIRTNTL